MRPGLSFGGRERLLVELPDLVGREPRAQKRFTDAQLEVEVDFGPRPRAGLRRPGLADVPYLITGVYLCSFAYRRRDRAQVAVAGHDATAVVDPHLPAPEAIQPFGIGESLGERAVEQRLQL